MGSDIKALQDGYTQGTKISERGNEAHLPGVVDEVGCSGTMNDQRIEREQWNKWQKR